MYPGIAYSIEINLLPLQTTNVTAQYCELSITVNLTNHILLKEMGNTFGPNHASYLLVGDADNHILCKQRVTDSQLMSSGQLCRKLSVQRAKAEDEVRVHFVSVEKVGADVEEVFTPRYSTPPISGPGRNPQVCVAITYKSVMSKSINPYDALRLD